MVVTLNSTVSAANTPAADLRRRAPMQTWLLALALAALVHGGTIRQESGALAIARDTYARDARRR